MEMYLVSLYEEPGCVATTYFHCEADDDVHAAEQAKDAYPDAEIVGVNGMAVMEAA